MRSIWQEQSFSFQSDVIIIGCGLTGLQTGIDIKSDFPKLNVRIVERGSSPEGASMKNAGFTCFGSISELIDDIKNEGEEKAYQRVLKRHSGLKALLTKIKNHDIGLSLKDGVEIFTHKEEALLLECESKLEGLNKRLQAELGFSPYSIQENTFGINALKKVIAIKGEGALDSGKLMETLIKKALEIGVKIDFNQDIQHLEKNGDVWMLNSKSYTFRSSAVVLATNGFTQTLLPQLAVLPGRGQIVLTSPIPGLKIDRSFHLHEGYYYFRNYNGRILLGGGRHLDRENETTTSQETSSLIQNELEELLGSIIIPGVSFKIESRWAGTMAFGPNNEKDPIVKTIEPGLFVAVRLGGMGLSISSTVAKETKEMVCSYLSLST